MNNETSQYYFNKLIRRIQTEYISNDYNVKEKAFEKTLEYYIEKVLYHDFLCQNNNDNHFNLLHKNLIESSPTYVELYNEFMNKQYIIKIVSDPTKIHDLLIETDSNYKSLILKHNIIFEGLEEIVDLDSDLAYGYYDKIREFRHTNSNNINFMIDYIRNNKSAQDLIKSKSLALNIYFMVNIKKEYKDIYYFGNDIDNIIENSYKLMINDIINHNNDIIDDIIDDSYKLMIKDKTFYNDFLNYINLDKFMLEYTNLIYNSNIQKKINYINMFKKNIKVNDIVYTYHSDEIFKNNKTGCYSTAIAICIENDIFSEEMIFTAENIKFVFTYSSQNTLKYFINTYYDKIFNAVCNEQWKLIHYILHYGTNELFNLAIKQGIKHNLYMILNDIQNPTSPDEFKIAFTITITK
jgi:hypothetical protein